MTKGDNLRLKERAIFEKEAEIASEDELRCHRNTTAAFTSPWLI